MIPDEVSVRLKEWAAYFKDRQSHTVLGSAESRYKPHSDDYAAEGWGDIEKSPTQPPRKANWVLRAQQVQDVMTELSKTATGKLYVWALTYSFAYPHLPRHLTLRLMKKYTNRRMSWKQYEETIDMGMLRIHAGLSVKCL